MLPRHAFPQRTQTHTTTRPTHPTHPRPPRTHRTRPPTTHATLGRYAGYLFTEGVLKALKGEPVTQCAYVESTVTEAKFFASPCKFGPNGVEEVLGFGELSAYEKGWFDKMMPELKAQIQKGEDFVNK